jgi:hypothetical protein
MPDAISQTHLDDDNLIANGLPNITESQCESMREREIA